MKGKNQFSNQFGHSKKLIFYILILILFLQVTSNSFAQKYPSIVESPTDLPIKDGRVVYQGIIEVPGSNMAELYGFAKKFIAENYKNTDAAIDMDDSLNGVIIVKGRADVPIIWYENKAGRLEKVGSTASVKHVLIFEIKENRLRYTFKDFIAENSVTYQSLYSFRTVDFEVSVEEHLGHRLAYNSIPDPKNKDMSSANYSGAFLVAVNEFFKNFSGKIEPYMKNQK